MFTLESHLFFTRVYLDATLMTTHYGPRHRQRAERTVAMLDWVKP